ncbi:MAG: hypothetical protein MJZ34_02610 [Paludibacteraceae bacterium]|nr:hypothetical protein [Paludibacteraceae bacterium]
MQLTDEEFEQLIKQYALAFIIRIVKHWNEPDLLDNIITKYKDLESKSSSRLSSVSVRDLFKAIVEKV